LALITKIIIGLILIIIFISFLSIQRVSKWKNIVELPADIDVQDLMVGEDLVYITGNLVPVSDMLRKEDIDKTLGRAEAVIYLYDTTLGKLIKKSFGRGVLLQSVSNKQTDTIYTLGFDYSKGMKKSFLITWKAGENAEYSKKYLPNDFLHIDVKGNKIIGSDGRSIYLSYDSGSTWENVATPKELITAYPRFGSDNSFAYAAGRTLYLSSNNIKSEEKVNGIIQLLYYGNENSWFLLWTDDKSDKSVINISKLKNNADIENIYSITGLLPKLFEINGSNMLLVGSEIVGSKASVFIAKSSDQGKSWKVSKNNTIHTRTFALSDITLYGVGHQYNLMTTRLK
jgi:hypothetical protein